jgi:type VI protein secretion system component VasF
MVKILKWVFCIILFLIAVLFFGIVWLFSFKTDEYSDVLTELGEAIGDYLHK